MNKTFIVNNEHLANIIGSGKLPVLSTPSLLSFIENTCMEKMNKDMHKNNTSVGTKVILKHIKPSLEKDEIKCFIKGITTIEKKWIFNVEVFSKNKLIAICEHTRYVVNKEEFMK